MRPGGWRVARYVVGAALVVVSFWAGWQYQQAYAAGWIVASKFLLPVGLWLVGWDLAVRLQRRYDRRRAEAAASPRDG